MKLEFVANEEKYYDFIRCLRNDPEAQRGFIEQVNITHEQQLEYMSKHASKYFICLVEGQPAGFIGTIDGDIRVATHPKFQNQGVASFLVKELLKKEPNCFAKVKVDNEASLKLFSRAGFKPAFVIMLPPKPEV